MAYNPDREALDRVHAELFMCLATLLLCVAVCVGAYIFVMLKYQAHDSGFARGFQGLGYFYVFQLAATLGTILVLKKEVRLLSEESISESDAKKKANWNVQDRREDRTEEDH